MTQRRYDLTKRNNGVYYIGWYEGEKRVWKSTKLRRKKDAEQYLRQFKPSSAERPFLHREE
jgi:hypothetical protein